MLNKGLLTRCFGAILLLSSMVAAQEIPVHKFYAPDGKEWKIETRLSLHEFADTGCYFSPNCIILGFTEQKTRTVYVLWTIPTNLVVPDDQRSTLFHELQHVIYGPNADRQVIQHEDIRQLSRPMMLMLRDRRNEALMRWLFEEDR